MCVPVMVAAAVVAVASTAASVIGQIQSAKAQKKAIGLQQQQAAEEARLATSGEMFERNRAARREQGRIRTAAGEAGLALNSGAVEQLLMDSSMQNKLSNDRSLANMESRIAASDAEANSMRSRIVQPTALGAGLQIASSALDQWSGIKQAKIKRG